ncbi:MAG TPA: CoA-binding protein, partial [Saprospiraceae bacterium]|nr:CoA-binding protein [Saprospiraceae bacterium]
MKSKNNTPFKYYVGIRSLEDIASKDDRIVVMNILGNESRKVTPVSHVFSGKNVVAGVQYGRPGTMKTDAGPIPVYSRLAEVVEKHEFNTGVIYLPPAAVYYAVAEMCHYNDNLEKLVIVTEKLSVKDQRLIRAVAQINKVDVFGANSLGVADAWNRVRIGGGLGGDRPDELLLKGSIALHSNSGNFSTTITEYLKTQGFGTSTVVSSGKDKIIQFAVAEFLYAAENDARTKAVVLYVEPGGYYEKQALDWIQEGRIKFTKPIVVLVTGRWKAKLTRAVGHAGALAGSDDGAIAKEKWFDKYVRKKAFDPDKHKKVSKKGVRVSY